MYRRDAWTLECKYVKDDIRLWDQLKNHSMRKITGKNQSYINLKINEADLKGLYVIQNDGRHWREFDIYMQPFLLSARITIQELVPFRKAFKGSRWFYFSIWEVCAIFEVVSLLLLFVLCLFPTSCYTLKYSHVVSLCSFLI